MADDIKIVGLSSKKAGGTNWKVISAIVGIVVLSIGVIAGIFLVREQQDIREKATGNCEDPKSIVQCPRSDGALVSCNPPDSNNNAQISICNVAGRIESCGLGTNVKEYCCPTAGGAWTLDMTACTCDAKAPTGPTSTDITDTSAKLNWTGGTGGKLRLWVSTDPNPTGTCSPTSTTCVVNDKELTISTSQYELTDLKPNTKYYWRIIAWTREGCDSGNVPYSFTTLAAGTATTMPTTSSTPIATSTSKASTTATSTSKATATSTAKATTTAKATSTTKASGSATAFPVPETGADFPTMLGLGLGVIMVLVSLALAL